MTEKPISIVFAADASFVIPLAVALTSVARHSKGREHQVFVLHAGFEPTLMKKLETTSSPETTMTWLDARSDHLRGTSLPPTYASEAALFRLRVAELVPTELSQVIYLDSDVIVRNSLEELWGTALRDELVGAVRDGSVPWTGPLLDWRSLDIPPATPYFNTGVLLIPVDRWRAEAVFTRALDLLRLHSFNYPDQDALNVLSEGNWSPLHPRWNLQSAHLEGDHSWVRTVETPERLDAALDDPAIVHLSSGAWRRPWEPACAHPFRDEWLSLLDTTPWKGWRPKEPTRRTAARLRTRRAAEILLRGR